MLITINMTASEVVEKLIASSVLELDEEHLARKKLADCLADFDIEKMLCEQDEKISQAIEQVQELKTNIENVKQYRANLKVYRELGRILDLLESIAT